VGAGRRRSARAQVPPLGVTQSWSERRGADPRGSLWVGSMRKNVNVDGSTGEAGGKDGILYRQDPDRRVTICRRDLGISNTLAWNPDQQRFISVTLWRTRSGPITMIRPPAISRVRPRSGFLARPAGWLDGRRRRLSLELPVLWRMYRAGRSQRKN
jgi:hypothetical protein